jgi:7,8-dihydropterin-6-yl-methyl-4-(beta-D-ribofuranosyl)aminobenzene 5'-phosphate synthase
VALEDLGFAIVEERQPSFLLDGAVLITGEVDRTTPFETGFQGHEALRDTEWRPDPLILDDQALVLRPGRARGSARAAGPRTPGGSSPAAWSVRTPGRGPPSR